MPLPTKRTDEPRKEFISRCMSDDMMNTEFKDPKQRAAVCNSQFERRKKVKVQRVGTMRAKEMCLVLYRFFS